MVWGESDTARIVSVVLSGDWLGDVPGLTIEPGVPEAAGDRAIALLLRLGAEHATVVLDATGFVPLRLELRSSFGARTWAFEGFGAPGGLVYPERVVQELPGGIVKRYVIEQVAREPLAHASLYAAPAGAGASFDPAAPAEIAVERSGLGFLMVRPVIDGRDVGAFIFDTGAGTNVITPRAAAALELTRIGTGWLGLAAGSTTGHARRARARCRSGRSPSISRCSSRWISARCRRPAVRRSPASSVTTC